MKRKELVLAFMLLGTGLSLIACSAASQTRKFDLPNPKAAAPTVVHALQIQTPPRLSEGDLLIPAALSVENTAVVLAERDGQIVKLAAPEGASVRRGDDLAKFNDEAERDELRQAELEVSRLQVETRQYEALIKLSRTELDREKLLAAQGLVSQSEVERAQYKLEQSVHEREKSRLAAEGAEARTAVVKLELQKRLISAPVAGVVTRRYVALGTTVAKNDKLFEITQLSNVELKFRVPQSEGPTLRLGTIVSLSTVDPNSIVARARIRRVEPIADPTSNTFGYVADLVGKGILMPGTTVQVHLRRGAGARSEVWVPRAAFTGSEELQNGATRRLYIVKGETVRVRSVMVRKGEGDQVLVESDGLKGELVVISPSPFLKEGDRVEVREN